MKKLLASVLTIMFLGVISGPLFAQTPAPEKTPVAKTMKHKKTHKKRMEKAKKAATPSTTPTAK